MTQRQLHKDAPMRCCFIKCSDAWTSHSTCCASQETFSNGVCSLFLVKTMDRQRNGSSHLWGCEMDVLAEVDRKCHSFSVNHEIDPKWHAVLILNVSASIDLFLHVISVTGKAENQLHAPPPPPYSSFLPIQNGWFQWEEPVLLHSGLGWHLGCWHCISSCIRWTCDPAPCKRNADTGKYGPLPSM